MRKLFGGLVVAVLALSLATVAQAQRRTTTSAAMGGAKHEFGIDLGVAYVKPSNVSGGMSIQTPVDVRFGFVPRSGKMMWEPRLSLTFNTVGGNTSYLFTPQVTCSTPTPQAVTAAGCTSPAVQGCRWAISELAVGQQ